MKLTYAYPKTGHLNYRQLDMVIDARHQSWFYAFPIILVKNAI